MAERSAALGMPGLDYPGAMVSDHGPPLGATGDLRSAHHLLDKRGVGLGAIQQDIVPRLSPGHVHKVLKKSPQPYRCRYWLNAKADPGMDERIANICAVYHEGVTASDSITFSVDEMTGIQALERIATDLPMAPSKPWHANSVRALRHPDPNRCAIQVTMGRAFAHCGATRTESDFRDFIAALIRAHPGYRTYHLMLPRCQDRSRLPLGGFV